MTIAGSGVDDPEPPINLFLRRIDADREEPDFSDIVFRRSPNEGLPLAADALYRPYPASFPRPDEVVDGLRIMPAAIDTG